MENAPPSRLSLGLILAIIGLSLSTLPCILAIVAVWQIPKFQQIFLELNIQLPELSRMVLRVGPAGLMVIALLFLIWPMALLLVRRRVGWLLGAAILLNGLAAGAFCAGIMTALFLPLIEIINALNA